MRVLPLLTLAPFALSGVALGQEPALEDMETACAALKEGYCASLAQMTDADLCSPEYKQARPKKIEPVWTQKRNEQSQLAAIYHTLVSRHGEELATKIRKAELFIGMPEWAVTCSWGRPTRINVSADASGEKKEYVYEPDVNRQLAIYFGSTAEQIERGVANGTRRVEVRDGKVAAYQMPVVQ